MMKILVVATGGTIGSVRTDCIDLDSNNMKILDFCKRDGVEFVGTSPFSVLSEDMGVALWRKLFACLSGVDYSAYDGVIILHGSDTLSYTAAMVGNAFSGKSIALVAADKPIEDPASNGIANFNMAVDRIARGISSPIVCYDGVYDALGITALTAVDGFVDIGTDIAPVSGGVIYDKKIVIVPASPVVDMADYNLVGADAVVVDMYHSATVPAVVRDFAQGSDLPFVFVTHRSSADYATSQGMGNILYGCTVENAVARILLTK